LAKEPLRARCIPNANSQILTQFIIKSNHCQIAKTTNYLIAYFCFIIITYVKNQNCH